MFTTVMLKLKKIEITINPNYSSADEVLKRLQKFMFLSRCILITAMMYILFLIIVFIAVSFTHNMMMAAFWSPVFFSSVFFMFLIFITYYFWQMGLKFIESLESDGARISKWKSRSFFIIMMAMNFIGMLNYSFVQIFNYVNDQDKIIDCQQNVMMELISDVISWCYVISPFITSLFLI